MADVVLLDQVIDWYNGLGQQDTDAVFRAIENLEARGVRLGYPLSSQVKGSRHAMRELRIQSGGVPIRILYVFDPKRQAVLLLGAHKGGDDDWYRTNVPIADQRYEGYLAGI